MSQEPVEEERQADSTSSLPNRDRNSTRTPFEESARKVAEGVATNLISAGAIYLAAVASGWLDATPVTQLVILAFAVLMTWQLNQYVVIPMLGRPLTMEKILVAFGLAAVQLLIVLFILDII